MKQIHTFHRLVAIVMIAWFVVPVCCCTGKGLGKDSEAVTRSCCQSAGAADDTPENRQTPQCPCGKRTLIEGKAESHHLAPPADFHHLLAVAVWIPATTPTPEAFPDILISSVDLPPPGTSWFAVSGSWLL